MQHARPTPVTVDDRVREGSGGVPARGAKSDSQPLHFRELPSADPYVATVLLDWFRVHGRVFPWRTTTDPYHILCAEVFLQRTRAAQVVPVFQAFIERFSSPRAVLSAGKAAVRSIFGRLGLLWRADLFWELQAVLVSEYRGVVPREHRQLLALPGVGEYAATATRVFAFGEIDTVVDANVLRILSRFYGMRLPEHLRRNRAFRMWAGQLAPLDSYKCREFNWALIDHGALVCTASSPRCAVCPLSLGCCYNRLRDAPSP